MIGKRGRELRATERLFWEKVDQSGGVESCWPWTGSLTEKNYGHMSAGRGNYLKSHRVAWSLYFGKIPEGMCILHHCDNPPCCNPDHLFMGTKKDNAHDMMGKGRMSPPPIHCGDSHPMRRYPELAERMRGQNNGNSRTNRALREEK